MGQETIKLELIEWLTKLNDFDTLHYLKIVKDSIKKNQDWWNDLAEEQKLGIQRGLNNIDEGKIVSHDSIKDQYGL